MKGKKAFGVQYHPEASPGPQDSFYLFEKFVGMLESHRDLRHQASALEFPRLEEPSVKCRFSKSLRITLSRLVILEFLSRTDG